MSGTPFEPMPDELTGLRTFLESQRASILEKSAGLTEEQATSHPTVSDFCMLTLVKHVAFVERRWVLGAIGRRLIPGVVPPENRDQEFRADPEEDVDSLRRFYADVARENDAVLDGITELDAWSGREGMTTRAVLLHLLEELAQHCGQLDIIRESIDGRQDLD